MHVWFEIFHMMHLHLVMCSTTGVYTAFFSGRGRRQTKCTI